MISAVDLSLTPCCVLRYIEDLQLRITSAERLIRRVSQGHRKVLRYLRSGLCIIQYAPGQDLDDLLDDAPSRTSPPPSGSGNLILPSRFFLPSGERVETRSSHGNQSSGVFPTANAAQNGRGEHYGSTSICGLAEFALEHRDGVECEPMPFEDRFPERRREFWQVHDVSLFLSCNLRKQADFSQWLGPQASPSPSRLEFPPPDIITSLVDSYFAHSNIYYPVLHRPTFQRLLDQEYHRRDGEFGCVLLAVCAIGARFSDHPYVSGVTAEGTNYYMARWLSQTRKVMEKPFTSTATLFEVQHYCVSRLSVRILDLGAHKLKVLRFQLYVICLDGFPDAMRWITLGMGIRLAKSVGANHAKTYGDKPTIEGELWKRVFW